ncbi:hypothetical protein M8C21_032178 [Ambrosia artemisiifolia]|uniref:Uncharacterized protein n=1 Tax=Ambrosia artemisiifolia TaxID=4212 RepID=A0AAD5CUR0_AMBAR|nr:hypothetical protein M8C21_032178 [Ambrosia artemisiifolia]
MVIIWVFRCISIVTTYDYVDSLRGCLFPVNRTPTECGNIWEYEENLLAAAQELADEKLSLSNTMSKLKYQLEYEKKRDIVFVLYNLVQKYASSTEKQRDNIAITDSLNIGKSKHGRDHVKFIRAPTMADPISDASRAVYIVHHHL